MEEKSILKIIFSRITGFIVFLILLGISFLIAPHVQSRVYFDIVSFFYSNIWLLTIIMVIGLINEIMWSFSFPFNIIAPLTGGALSLYVVIFIYRILQLIGIQHIVDLSLPVIMAIVFAIAIIGGYALIAIRFFRVFRSSDKTYFAVVKERDALKKELASVKEDCDEEVNEKHREEWEEFGNRLRNSFRKGSRALKEAFSTDEEQPEESEKNKKKKGKRKNSRDS
jgi:hypothetical protein